MIFNDLSHWLVDYVAAYPAKYSQIPIWREPVMACAPAGCGGRLGSLVTDLELGGHPPVTTDESSTATSQGFEKNRTAELYRTQSAKSLRQAVITRVHAHRYRAV